jgi:hypothetical protein
MDNLIIALLFLVLANQENDRRFKVTFWVLSVSFCVSSALFEVIP